MAIKKKFPYRAAVVACNGGCRASKTPDAKCVYGCIGCGLCEKVCTADAIHVADNVAVIDDAKCLSCGMCAVNCPRGAIIDKRGILTGRY